MDLPLIWANFGLLVKELRSIDLTPLIVPLSKLESGHNGVASGTIQKSRG